MSINKSLGALGHNINQERSFVLFLYFKSRIPQEDLQQQSYNRPHRFSFLIKYSFLPCNIDEILFNSIFGVKDYRSVWISQFCIDKMFLKAYKVGTQNLSFVPNTLTAEMTSYWWFTRKLHHAEKLRWNPNWGKHCWVTVVQALQQS